MRLLRFVLLLVLWLVVVASAPAQCDETCSAGDILWVKDTVAADRTFDGAGTGACYNDFDAPFGIEAAARSFGLGGGICNDAIVRIVLGADNYGAASASWAGRVSATNRLSFSWSTATGSKVTWEGWIDENTPCTAWDTGGCPVTLDFDTGTGSGLQLNNDGTSSTRFVFQWLRIINAATNGIEAPLSSAFYNIESSLNGAAGLTTLAISSEVLFSRFTGNAGDGLVDGSGGSQGYLAYNRSYGNGDDGINCANSVCAWNLSYGNGGDGFESNLTNSNYLHNVARANTGDGIKIAGTIDNVHLVGNLLVDNGGFGLNISAAGRSQGLVQQNNYRGNVAGASAVGAGTTIRLNIDGIPGAGDETDCPFVNPDANLALTEGCLFSFVFPPEAGGGVTTTSNLVKGAAQNTVADAGGGGANVAY